MGEELANSITHIVGSHLGAAMLGILFKLKTTGRYRYVSTARSVTSSASSGM